MENKRHALILQRRPLPRKLDGNNNNNDDWLFNNLANNSYSSASSHHRHRRHPTSQQDYGKKKGATRRKIHQSQSNRVEDPEINCLLKPLVGPSPFPQRSLRKPPWQFSKKNAVVNDANLFIDQALLLSMLQAENQSKHILEVKANHTVKHNVSEDKILHILNLHEEESLPEIARRKPWRQYMLEEQQKGVSQRLPAPVSIKMDCTDVEDDVFKHSEVNKNLYISGFTYDCDSQHQTFDKQLSNYLEQQDNDNEQNNNHLLTYGQQESSFKLQYDKMIDKIYRNTLKASNEGTDGEDSCWGDNNETKLNLKAYFIDLIPDLPYPLFKTLVWINLSFNDFEEFPEQLFHATNVIYLNMRNNPISVIPDGIKNLKKLKYLNLSFCYLTNIHRSVFSLTDLEILDISYNHLTSIGAGIKNLRLLKELYLDGNYVRFFPTSILTLKLNSLRCNGNLINKLFWKESLPVEPQRLVDIVTTVLARSIHLIPSLQTHLENYRFSKCEYCGEMMPCDGIPVIKPVAQLFSIPNVPLLFHVCSQTCKKELLLASQLPINDFVKDT